MFLVFSFVAVHVSVRDRVTAFLAQLDLIEVQQKSDLASLSQQLQESQARTRILTTLKAQLAAKGSLPRRRLFWLVLGQPCILAVRDFSTRLFRLDQSDTSPGDTLLGACALDDAACACFGRDLVSLWSVHLGRDVVSLWSVVAVLALDLDELTSSSDTAGSSSGGREFFCSTHPFVSYVGPHVSRVDILVEGAAAVFEPGLLVVLMCGA